jgi:hypothetical protein
VNNFFGGLITGVASALLVMLAAWFIGDKPPQPLGTAKYATLEQVRMPNGAECVVAVRGDSVAISCNFDEVGTKQ